MHEPTAADERQDHVSWEYQYLHGVVRADGRRRR